MRNDTRIIITKIKQTGKYKFFRESNFIGEEKILLYSESVLYDDFFGVVSEIRKYEIMPEMKNLNEYEEEQIKSILEKELIVLM